MNKRQVIKELQQKYPGKNIICIPEKGRAKEIICELGPIEGGGSRAVAVIDASELHYHLRTTEIYRIIKGELTLQYDNTDKACVLTLKDKHLKEGDTFTVRPGTIHRGIGKAAWVEADTFPAWTPEDHHPVKCED